MEPSVGHRRILGSYTDLGGSMETFRAHMHIATRLIFSLWAIISYLATIMHAIRRAMAL